MIFQILKSRSFILKNEDYFCTLSQQQRLTMPFENKQVTIVTIFLDFSLFPLSQAEDYRPRLNPRYVVNKMHIANFLVHTSKALDSSTCYNTCKVPLLYISTHTYNKEAF